MGTMADACPGCDLTSLNSDNSCDVDNNCLKTDCVSSFTPYGSVFINSTQVFLNTDLISDPDDHSPPEFQSQPPGSLYRPPIT